MDLLNIVKKEYRQLKRQSFNLKEEEEFMSNRFNKLDKVTDDKLHLTDHDISYKYGHKKPY